MASDPGWCRRSGTSAADASLLEDATFEEVAVTFIGVPLLADMHALEVSSPVPALLNGACFVCLVRGERGQGRGGVLRIMACVMPPYPRQAENHQQQYSGSRKPADAHDRLLIRAPLGLHFPALFRCDHRSPRLVVGRRKSPVRWRPFW